MSTETKSNPNIIKLVTEFRSLTKSKGSLTEWSDTLLVKTRDKFRSLSRKTRGKWTLEFYEIIQKINKESFKRELG